MPDPRPSARDVIALVTADFTRAGPAEAEGSGSAREPRPGAPREPAADWFPEDEPSAGRAADWTPEDVEATRRPDGGSARATGRSGTDGPTRTAGRAGATGQVPAGGPTPADGPEEAGVPAPGDETAPAARPAPADGPIQWAGYDNARAVASLRTGEDESVVYGTASIGGRPCVLVAFEFGFLGGSLGRAAGDRLVAAYRAAAERRIPLVSLVATGGSRMQEGMVALIQLQRVAVETVRLREAGVAHVAVLRDPATGGGWATVGAGADVVLALPSAQVAFAGSRVRPPDADPAAYTAEDQYAHGHVDAVVRPEELRDTLALWLRLLSAPADGPGAG
ncbi:carboxyl transferase domain-containing protein, partial [Streptomyces sp. NPDC048629]|uniref:carboxyl transferase domain-containing protein n=1 Tax=Streptomyces sp. NPDC048629 TaxID=3154824 RepID=UPI00342F6C90